MSLKNATADASAERNECHKLHFDQLDKLDDAQALFNAALRLLHAAAQKNHREAQYVLGKCYKEGNGVEQNYFKSACLLNSAADHGHQNASVTLNELHADLNFEEVMLAVCL